MDIYEPIPDFGQIVEYITQADPVQQGENIYYGLKFYHMPITRDDLNDDNTIDISLREILADYVKVFRILIRMLDLELPELDNVIPNRIRLRVNVWLSNRGYPTIPAGTTYKQFLVALRNRIRG